MNNNAADDYAYTEPKNPWDTLERQLDFIESSNRESAQSLELLNNNLAEVWQELRGDVVYRNSQNLDLIAKTLKRIATTLLYIALGVGILILKSH